MPENILIVGAHPDDAELGAGASAARWVEEGKSVTFLIMTAGANGPGEVSRRVSEQQHAAAVMGVNLVWGDFPDGTTDQHEYAMLQRVENVLVELAIDTVLVHDPRDTHQDHRAVSTAVLGATRRVSRVLYMESPSSTNFAPDIYVPVEEHHLETKIKSLHCHSSQVSASQMVDEGAVFGQARYRGFQSRAGQYAEGFRAIRFSL